MKRLKKILALALAMAMVLGMTSMAAFAADPPASGSITINSPVVDATYNVYKIFDMETNADKNAFSYSIDENNPFYGKVVEYAGVAANGLTLTRISGSNPAVYNVTVDESKFKAQDFGKAMQSVLTTGSPKVTADDAKGIVAKDAGTGPIAATATKKAAITSANTSGQLKFDELALGYFLINPTYPAASYGKVSMGTGENKQEFTTDDLTKDADGKVVTPLALTTEAEGKITTYVQSQIGTGITDEKFTQYLTDKGITTNKDGSPLDDTGKQQYYDELNTELTNDAKSKVLNTFANQFAGSGSDINVKPEPTMVFLDSSQPDAVINEKNEIDKWDVPVNPQGDVNPGTPDHGEPSGGKNIVVQENPQYFADWSEAKIGDSVHYQLRVNAMNFINTGSSDETIQQVKEYFLADYQSAQMHFDTSKKLTVTVWQGDNGNDSQASSKVNVTKNADGSAAPNGLDYTDVAMTKFFKNTSNKDGKATDFDQDNNSVFGDGTGIMVPWVKVSEANPSQPDPAYPIYTQNNVPKVDGEGHPIYKTEQPRFDENNAKIPATTASGEVIPGQFVSENGNIIDAQNRLLDENNQPIQDYDFYYVYSLYNSDVTIVVDYWMILDDKAIVDEPGNKNFAQYGWSPVDNKDNNGKPKKPENPKDTDKPEKKEKVDEATVYTYALAWVKTDNKANQLAGAKFQLPFYVKTTKDNDGAYVYGGTTAGEGLTNEVITTTESAVITIKGVQAGTYSIKETEAPDGYNKLPAPFDVEAKKSGNGVTTKTKTTIWLDAQGNVVKEESEKVTSVDYNTDVDSFNNANTADPEEKSVPVYQFDPIVNQKGTELPSTGGIGTTIFYVVGAILVIGAGVVLITKRRMDA